MLNKLDHIMMKVDNLDKSIEFFEETLESTVIWEYDNYVGFSNGLVIHDSDNSETISVFFQVDSVANVVNLLKQKGVNILLEPTPIPTNYTAIFEDLNSNKIHIVDNVNLK